MQLMPADVRVGHSMAGLPLIPGKFDKRLVAQSQDAAAAATINEGNSLSDHAHPLRSVDANRVSGATSQVECNTARKWAAVVNHHSNRLPVLRIHHRHPRSERQRAMRGRIPGGIECLTTRRAPPRVIKGCDYMLPRTRALRFGVREEPSEAPTVSLLGRCG